MKVLIIQTSFLGDVILATPVVEQIKKHYPTASIDLLVRKGNESLLEGHPKINQVLIWEKRQRKFANLWKLLLEIRKNSYDKVVNLHRFASSGFLTAFSGAQEKIGFKKNPLSKFFDRRCTHLISRTPGGPHDVQRNLFLIQHFTDDQFIKPRLYPSEDDFQRVATFLRSEGPASKKYVTMAPASVWFTKQLPEAKWIELIQRLGPTHTVYLLGGKDDFALCGRIAQSTGVESVENLAGKLSLLQSAALMKRAAMNYVNDSAPLHLASAVNAPVTAFFCSTVPEFGFGPLSDQSKVMEVQTPLPCRPCGLHGKRACPQGHFQCGDIDLPKVLL